MWFDTNRLPSVRRTVEGDYDTVLKGVEGALGTVWNNWQTDWVGEPVSESTSTWTWVGAGDPHGNEGQRQWAADGTARIDNQTANHPHRREGWDEP